MSIYTTTLVFADSFEDGVFESPLTLKENTHFSFSAMPSTFLADGRSDSYSVQQVMNMKKNIFAEPYTLEEAEHKKLFLITADAIVLEVLNHKEVFVPLCLGTLVKITSDKDTLDDFDVNPEIKQGEVYRISSYAVGTNTYQLITVAGTALSNSNVKVSFVEAFEL